jgi:BNR repeat-like domain
MKSWKAAGAAKPEGSGAKRIGKSSSNANVNVSLIMFAFAALAAVVLASAAPFAPARAASASSGSLDPQALSALARTWNGAPLTNLNPQATEAGCQDGATCDTYKLTLTGSPADWTGKVVHVRIDWKSQAFDYALSIHKGTNAGPVVASSDNAINSPRNWEATDIDPSTMGTGDFSIHVIYFTTSTTDPYKGAASVGPKATTAVPGPGVSTETAPGYGVYTPPAGFQKFDAGEPSIGVNWKTGSVFYQSSLQTMRVRFDDSASPARATWEDVSAPTTSIVSLDPILYTDSRTGRVFSSQLAGVTSLTAFSDDDGQTWTPSQGAGIPASIDHQTLGGGPFAAPLARDASLPLYQNAVYYCSQDVGYDASCAVSLDGGLTFGPAVRIYTFLDCEAGLHGHVKVAPDGTAYVPSRACGGQQAVVVSENNGLTWSVRKVAGSSAGGSDPSVGVGSDGTVYFAYSNGDGRARAVVSHDKGKTWGNTRDLGANFGIQSSVFPSAVAGDANRAAIFFLGSALAGAGATGGDPAAFEGAWFPYIATTYDGGNTWITVNASPNDPVQRGPVCLQGTLGCQGNTRNLLDFNDLTVDKFGRVLAGLSDGCVTDACRAGVDRNNDGHVDGNDNDGGAVATIIRQASGKGLFSQYDTLLAP